MTFLSIFFRNNDQKLPGSLITRAYGFRTIEAKNSLMSFSFDAHD